jgi:hypothetical protein
MASNFKMSIHQDNGDLHLKLKGDFDGSSAFELINVLKAYHGKVKKIIINTHSLSSVHPFGLGVFHKICSTGEFCHCLLLTGKYGNTMTPSGGYSL